MKKETITTILATIIVVFVLLFLIGSKEEKVSIPLDNINTQFKEGFLNGCSKSGETSYDVCLCSYNSIINEVGEEGILDLSVNYIETGELSVDILNKISEDCFQD